MDNAIADAFFEREAGAVWNELRSGLWHVTPSHRFRSILKSGEIHPNPLLPEGEFQWAPQSTTHCRVLDAVSLFDFHNADWPWIFKNNQQHYWMPFLQTPGTVKSPDIWIATVWLAMDRNALPGLLPLAETASLWPGSGHRKWMPRLEACHKGPIPLSACSHAVVVCAVEPSRFEVMTMRPFDLSGLDRLEERWRVKFSERYATRSLSVEDRLQLGLQYWKADSAKR